MRAVYAYFLLACIFLTSCSDDDSSGSGSGASAWGPETFTLYDDVTFYSTTWNADDYSQAPSTTEPFRYSNTAYALFLNDETLDQIGTSLDMDIIIGAACDNYDRLAYVNLAFMDKGETYNHETAESIEIARFITPFMNKNVQPDEVPYHFEMDDVARILRDEAIRDAYDIYLEFDVFGYTAAGQNEVAGCSGSVIAFYGTLSFTTSYDPEDAFDNPVYFQPLSYKYQLHNYINANDDVDAIDGAGTNVVGETVRSVTFDLSSDVKDASLYLITSNHGANSGGEEYNRRDHFVYFDGEQVLEYMPGEISCEPYRQYNTQGNGIYGQSPRSQAEWQSFSNWCPGSTIPVRTIDLGDVAAGSHTFELTVPDAQFVNNEGYIPVSVFITGEEQ